MKILILLALIVIIAIAITNIANDYMIDGKSNMDMISTSEDSPTKYLIKFTSMWGKDPRINHPENPHTGNMFLVSHDDEFELFKNGKFASKGVSQTAMFGTLDDLYTIANNNKQHIGKIVTSKVLETPGSSELMIDVSSDMHQLSFVTMIAPSSDWFTGFSIDLMKNEKWINHTTIPLYVHIAGTDSNQGFVTEHKLRTVPEPIKIKQDNFLYPTGQVVPIAYVSIDKITT
jgi:hypothetical protein